jgi:hypothetical protein
LVLLHYPNRIISLSAGKDPIPEQFPSLLFC